MFSRLAAFAALALPLLAAATPTVVARDSIDCCSSTIPATSDAATTLLKAIGVVLEDLDVLLGINCSPISVVGVGSGSECSSSPVSCSNGVIGGIGIGCVPINI